MTGRRQEARRQLRPGAVMGLAAWMIGAMLAACSDDADGTAAQQSGGAGASAAGDTGGGAANSAGTSPSGGAMSGGAGGVAGGGAAAGNAGAGMCPPGPGAASPENYLALVASGSRLEARVHSAPGMPTVFAGFFDTTLGVPCSFHEASDGQLRCLPERTTASANLGRAAADCSGDVFELSAACGSAGGYDRVGDACRSDRFVVRSLDPFNEDTVYFGNKSSCTGESTGPYANAYAAAAEVDPSTFVAGTETVLPGVCEGSLRLVETAGGARGPLEVVDVRSGVACLPRSGSCRPERVAFATPDLFSDAACTMPVTHASWGRGPSCGPPDYVTTPEGDIAEAGPPVTSVWSSFGMCEPALNKPFIGSVYEIGETAQLPSFDLLAIGNGRLRALVVSESGTPLFPTGRFQDTATGAECAPQYFADGTTRCVAASLFGGVQDFFADAACSEPIKNCDSNCESQLVVEERPDPSACTSRAITRVFRLIAQHTATEAYRLDAEGTCFASSPPAPTENNWVAEPVDPTELPELVVTAAPR